MKPISRTALSLSAAVVALSFAVAPAAFAMDKMEKHGTWPRTARRRTE